ncbi:cobalt-zinc-cadmium resistance protein CzcA [Zunongwangia mangrovi]|uniref:Cobalt-zinc-cadmium resistance protein CzcA n=1 Tax=Zunongwangia mangrovi TaxID=1334022 RepID=A0A1I1LU56_9FLAO|nr:CusA/CzcA family heavy metal efflux RND transporter [Zunongwangia mangrovi]SFC76664.1 cobalt-zinc-cadmium resistance protein CzcA [Zunongwangia mangrovi]
MLQNIIRFSLQNKILVGIFTVILIGVGIYSLSNIPIGAVPDITNNQVQVITTSQNLSTQDMERYITYPIELEMANLPGVKEIRSVSKFGLSVVTIVFDESLGTYLPRQLISEKINAAKESIPEGFGSPVMGPISTGLGEIYQYTLETEPGYEDQYDATELRSIQDWIVKRELSGIDGVVEINTWGGFLKQYEVAINSAKLSSLDIGISDILSALQANNSISGGGYIEKNDQVFFIRGDGKIDSLEKIRNTVVTVKGSTPIYVKDIAQVDFGHAPRYGAITGNGEGEKVLGQIMMLKGANSQKVINSVKERVAEIESNLPEGVKINPFLDRSELIGKTTFTITENLVLGFIIVIFVVVVILGDIRSGIIVASVIPLCLLFTLTMMYIFKIDANLMSLGAIDFGIIIDGAVIIVEYCAFEITQRFRKYDKLNKEEVHNLNDQATFVSASKMMGSAIFGQVIILIVFLPILSLTNVEGKMFRPMALAFSFAIIGAIILCLTYVPVASALFLKPKKKETSSLSFRVLEKVRNSYAKFMNRLFNFRKTVIAGALVLLAIAVYIFSGLGGEFIPQLDEGDFVIQPVFKTGTSLSATINKTTQMEQILLDKFPEVKQVVSRIGAAEVPTDPMSMEESDVIIALKDKSEWTTVETKDELAAKIKEELAVIPGMELEFTQPIEMRFNELITGVRADIAIKIFGQNLDILSSKANRIKSLIEDVPGASDITVEKIVGLPQITVDYNRAKLSKYGIDIQDVNEVLSMGFSGTSVGTVFEGERSFDLVMRLSENQRRDIGNLNNLYIDTPTAGKIPLREVADISVQNGAAKISRDDTKRRIVVGVNVRNRDLKSVVSDIQKIVDENISLPPGYTIDYGGQFENLESASKRLQIAIPIALILIFILLFFAFHDLREVLMIYSAIPFATIGGILFLWFRGMPFSISAGVGFIALFGIAVLNGIVLIEHYKEMSEGGAKLTSADIINGAKDRLRAVLLTALSAALGFLPMAISNNAGAEVQRPLATVVIGGLITSTLLTLVVLPIIYSLFHKEKKTEEEGEKKLRVQPLSIIIFFAMLSIPAMGQSQQKDPVIINNINELQQLASENNLGIKADSLEILNKQNLVSTAFNLEKTSVYYNYDESNVFNNLPLKTWGVSQDFDFPGVYFKQRKKLKNQAELQEQFFDLRKTILDKKLAQLYYEYQKLIAQENLYTNLDSLYDNFAHAASRKFELGESNYLEKITAQAKQQEIQKNFRQITYQKEIISGKINALVQSEDSILIAESPIPKLSLINFEEHKQQIKNYYQKEANISHNITSIEKQKILPGFNLEYFTGSNNNTSGQVYGYQVGLKIPLFFSSYNSQIKAAKINEKVADAQLQDKIVLLENEIETLHNRLKMFASDLEYYEDFGLKQADEIIKVALRSYQEGEIDFFNYIQSMESAISIKLSYLEKLNEYNNTIISLNNLSL